MDKNELTFSINEAFFQDISNIQEEARRNAKTAVNLSIVYAYYEIGRKIVEKEQNGENRAAYGKQLLKELSKFLTQKYGKGYSSDNLKLMRIDNIEERHFYEIEAVKNDWSLCELKRQCNSALYERLALSTDKKRVYRLALVFYNRLLRCLVLFGLKIGELKHQDIDQMQMYVHYYDRKVKLPEENSAIGILLCGEKNNVVVEMTLSEDNSQIFGKYETVLPGKDALRELLEEYLSDEDGGRDL